MASDASNKGIADVAKPLRDGWEHLDLAERAVRVGYWRTTVPDNKTFWSPGMYRLLGVTPDTQAPDAKWLLSQLREEDVANLKSKIRDSIKSHLPFQYRTRTIDPAAAAHIVDTNGEVELDDNGNVIAVFGVCHDVTARVLAEAEREITQKRYKLIAEESSDIIMLQENDKIVFASSALERVLERRPEEFQNGRYLKFVHPDDLEEAKKVLGRPNVGETRTAAYRVCHADGHYIWFEISTRGVHDEATGNFWEISVGRDVTQRKAQELEMRAAQERAEAASKAKSLFLSNMSHELRTPLNAIIGFTDVIRAGTFGPLGNERYDEYISLIHDSGQHLLGLIRDILDIAKIDADKLELSFEPIDLCETMRDVVDHLSERAASGKIVLEAELPGALPVFADQCAIRQIVLNLLSNAVKFTQPGGRVAVKLQAHNDIAILSVRDDGIGIPPDAVERLGRPFEQVCTDPMLAKRGAGLGLSIVRAFVEKHGGTMRIQSELGSGTEVTIELPCRQTQSQAA